VNDDIHPGVENIPAQSIGAEGRITTGIVGYRNRSDPAIGTGVSADSFDGVNRPATRFTAGNQFEGDDEFFRGGQIVIKVAHHVNVSLLRVPPWRSMKDPRQGAAKTAIFATWFFPENEGFSVEIKACEIFFTEIQLIPLR